MTNTSLTFLICGLLLVTQSLYAQFSSRLPTGILDSASIVSIECQEKTYDNIQLDVRMALDKHGINAVHSFFIPQNPTLRKKAFEEANGQLDSLNAAYWINLSLMFNSLGNSYLWIMTASETGDEISSYKMPKEYFLIRAKSLEKLFIKFEKSIKKLNNEKR